jgi:hypothetical protein
MNAVIGLFEQFEDAEEAISQLKEAGFSNDDIGVTARGYLVQERLNDEPDKDALQRAGVGAVAGTAVGGLLGLLASGVSMAVPVIGPVLAAGTLAWVIGGAAAGAVYGGLLGALLGAGASEEEATFYLDGLERGGVVVMVQAEGERAAEAWSIMRQSQALSAVDESRQLLEKPGYEAVSRQEQDTEASGILSQAKTVKL